MKRLFIALTAAAIALSATVACEHPHPNNDSNDTTDALVNDINTESNEWVFDYKNVGPLASKIWDAYIDTREMDIWQIYLSPVTNIEFEEIFDYTPVKITIPVDFPLDGAKIRLATDPSIMIEYGSCLWDAANAPNGFVSADYDDLSGNIRIIFHTTDKLKGHYNGPLTIIE